MDGIYCNECGVKLDETPTLLPTSGHPAPPAAPYPAVSRGTAAAIEMRTNVQAHAQTAEGVGEALPPTVHTVEARCIPGAAQGRTPP
jgi:hypothetical protein